MVTLHRDDRPIHLCIQPWWHNAWLKKRFGARALNWKPQVGTGDKGQGTGQGKANLGSKGTKTHKPAVKQISCELTVDSDTDGEVLRRGPQSWHIPLRTRSAEVTLARH